MPNATPAPNEPVRLRVVLSIAAGLLAEVFTIATVLAVILVHGVVARGESPEATRAFMATAPAIVGPVCGVIFTFLMSLWVVRRAKGRYMAHALLVAVGSIVVHVLTSVPGPGGYHMTHLVADLLKVVAAVAAAFFVERRTSAGRS
jgi:hypothetical protein